MLAQPTSTRVIPTLSCFIRSSCRSISAFDTFAHSTWLWTPARCGAAPALAGSASASAATGAIADPPAAAGVPVHDLPLVREPSPSDLAAIRTLRSLDGGGRYALVHAHSSKAGALVRAALPDRRRLLYTPHCFAFAARFGVPQQLVYRAIEQAVLPRSTAIVAVCDWERRQAERLWGARGLVRQIEYGVEPCAGAVPDPRLLAFRGDRPLVGMVSVLRPQKDPLLAVRAM